MSNSLFRGCEDSVTDIARSELEYLGVTGVIGESCSGERGNTCGKTISELLEQYPVYNPQRGLFNTWGDVPFPWEISQLTEDLVFSSTDDKWNVATYRSLVSYREGDRVLVIEEDGYVISLYEAIEDIPAISGPFDPSKWEKVCQIRSSVPAGVPTIPELLQRYPLYSLDQFNDRWEDVNSEWDEELTKQSEQDCLAQDLSFSEFEKCLKRSSSDTWKEARVARDFFYRANDLVLVLSECGDALCLYVATQDIPVSEQYFEDNQVFRPNSNWSRVYCVPTDENKCLGYRRTKTPVEGYDVTEIGSRGHYVEVPAPYRLKPPIPSLDERVE